MNFSTSIAGKVLNIEFSSSMDNLRIMQNGSKQAIDCVPLSANSFSLILNGKTYYLTITPHLNGYEVTVDHHTHLVQVKNELEVLLDKFGMQSETSSRSGKIYAQIPGLVCHIFVQTGDTVKTGAKLCILEAMKMENEIISPKNGTVTHIHINSGDKVEKGNLLMDIAD